MLTWAVQSSGYWSLVVEFQDEAARLARHLLTPLHADGAVGHRQPLLGAGDANVKQAALFVLGAFDDAALVRKDAFFQADEEDAGEFQAL